ncbi:hypothetical protein HMPREF1624_08093 [Sporothrix schenckii ATCC 58251]|uniref:PH domain-containing protein n=1 Tax=Sporothrix schenckii (strain ATCC 58251 / de Perez 2211183) TaxID=1391915 RepID=U7PJ65_SPOS1|nr:hypothetical protein HMPREF1624_08093 [Sporothrix schenckii ATCC 58251]
MLLHESFFSLKGVQERPVSVATEFMESDFDEDYILSDDESDDESVDGGNNSPRGSMNSSGQPSFTTVSSYDEVPTPRSSRMHTDLPLVTDLAKPVEGPRGPHLFRMSMLSAEFQTALSLSPLTPKAPSSAAVAFHMQQQQPQQQQQQLQQGHNSVPLPHGITPLPPTRQQQAQAQSGPFRFSHEELDTATLAAWSPEMVAQWMLNAGIELPVCERFIENDITGSILITLKFEDLKELGIPSFGVRTNVWNQINTMKNVKTAEPRPDTPIEDEPDREVRRELRREVSVKDGLNSGSNGNNKPMRRCASSRRRKPARASPGLPMSADDSITPMESVSIVGIEQMMPKPHQCSKGENCSKWRRNQRMMEAFKKDHPFVDVEKGGVIMVAGDPGNPETARAIVPNDDVFRPMSDAIPSVVASSDVMGPGTLVQAPIALEEESLRAVQSRDPQDNVRQFLDFQHQHVTSSEVPPTPPFELFPSRVQQPHEGLRTLPKLAIPSQLRQTHTIPDNQAFLQFQQQQQEKQHLEEQRRLSAGADAGAVAALPITSYPLSAETASAAPTSTTSYTNTAIEESPDSRTPTAPYRFGTPFTEVDVPVTAVPLGPVARDASQSVPPDMNYRAPLARTMSRASARRPSFPVLPSLAENQVSAAPRVMPAGMPRAASAMGHRPTYRSVSPEGLGQEQNAGNNAGARHLQPPPRVKYPWSPDRATFEKAIAPLSLITSTLNSSSSSLASASTGTLGSAASAVSGASTAITSAGGSMHSAASASGGISYQGEVKKRKTKMLRHEWNDRYVTLKGTRMAIHKDKASMHHSTLEYVDIDDYAIACSTMAASSSKLNAAFKAMNIRRGSADNVASGSSKNDVAAFAFQLIPQDAKGGVRLKKRDSAMPVSGSHGGLTPSSASILSSTASTSSSAPAPLDAVNGTGKTHHFAVKSRDDRIEWMRELMLAKAMRQKGEGFEVSVNGNMI